MFDVKLNDVASGGPITSLWVHYLLAVRRSSMQVHLNGERVPDTEVTFKQSGRSRECKISPSKSPECILLMNPHNCASQVRLELTLALGQGSNHMKTPLGLHHRS